MTRFSRLASVDFVHGYHLNFDSVPHQALDDEVRGLLSQRFDINRIFAIKPTAATNKILAGHRILFKQKSTGFLLVIEVDDSGNTPLVIPDSDLRLSFSLNLKDNYFCNYSALPTLSGGLYRFSNNSGNTATGNFLSRPVPDYDDTKTYEAGELYFHATDPGAGLFQAVRDTGPSAAPVVADWVRIPPDTYDSSQSYSAGAIVLDSDVVYRALINNPGIDLSNAGEWEQVTTLPNQHVTGEDYLPLYADQVTVDISASAISQANVNIYPLGSSASVLQQEFFTNIGTLDTLQVTLGGLSPGAYHLEVVDSSLTVLTQFNSDFYLDAQGLKEGWFGVIDLGLGGGSFALLNGSNQLNNPSYQISFLNRSTRWRYIFPQTQALGAGAEVAAEDADAQILVTNDPLPLTVAGSGIALQTDSAATPSVSEEVLLPQPNVNRIRYQASQWYSEIHMSNLPL